MKRKLLVVFLSLIALFCLVLGLTACDNSEANNNAVQNGVDGTDGKDGADGKDGTDGKDGADGKDGSDGKDGADGKDGIGIKKAEINSKGELIITYTDNTYVNLGKITGTDGADGNDGIDGKPCEHQYSEWGVGLQSTCTSIGYNIRICSLCGDKEYEFIEAVGHEWDNGTQLKQSTCIEGGLKVYICNVCSMTKAETTELSEHVYENYICKICGDEIYTEGLKYEEIKDDSGAVVAYTVADLGTATDMNVVIPSNYNGKPVTEIKDLAFAHPDNSTSPSPVSVKIGDNVMRIGEGAFADCHNLKNVTIGKSVVSIGVDAFYDCPLLESVYWNATACEYSGELDQYVLGYFAATENIKTIVFGENVTKIPAFAFFGCVRVKNLIIPANISYIGSDAFGNCINLEYIKYQGSQKQWEAIEKDSDWDYNTSNYIIHCTDGDITKE